MYMKASNGISRCRFLAVTFPQVPMRLKFSLDFCQGFGQKVDDF